MEKTVKVGKYNEIYNEILGINLKEKIIYQSKGLKTHMLKRKHFKAVKYVDDIPDIIDNPDYIGLSGSEDEYSIEYVKCFKDNMLLVIKMDVNKDVLYVASMFEINQAKLERFLHSGRLKSVDVTRNKK